MNSSTVKHKAVKNYLDARIGAQVQTGYDWKFGRNLQNTDSKMNWKTRIFQYA